ncbi:hypothetical protein PVAP13_3KG266073 [Panicum virgatum]|uniref:Uncharacterized protein n=1 Tax=Panicum virgatum TaxID=38727 RepID=A0A8T0UUH2_PANVG|nr:hypothetical protein PVAP13_3KG266073 [Panicum virgatum]
MDPSTPLANVTNQTKTEKHGRSNTYQIGEENIDPIEQPRQMRRQKYASLPEEEKERRRAMARENYKRWKGKTQNLDFDIQNYNRVKLDTFMKMDVERERCLSPNACFRCHNN